MEMKFQLFIYHRYFEPRIDIGSSCSKASYVSGTVVLITQLDWSASDIDPPLCCDQEATVVNTPLRSKDLRSKCNCVYEQTQSNKNSQKVSEWFSGL